MALTILPPKQGRLTNKRLPQQPPTEPVALHPQSWCKKQEQTAQLSAPFARGWCLSVTLASLTLLHAEFI